MKRLLVLLAVAMLPAASGCCCARLCPFCPCNWFSRGTVCPAPYAPVACAPATYVPSPCAPAYASPCATCAPAPGPLSALAANVMPQYVAPQMMQQPMYYPAPAAANCCAAAEPNCGCAAEPACGCGGYAPAYAGCSTCGGGYPAAYGYGGYSGCSTCGGGPYMGNVGYGPMMEGGCGGCSSCGSECGSCGGGCGSCGGGCSSCGGGGGCSNCDSGAPAAAPTATPPAKFDPTPAAG